MRRPQRLLVRYFNQFAFIGVPDFTSSLLFLKLGPYRPSNETLLLFYGYYKQATQGNNTQSAPWAFDVVAKAKWDAWKKYEDLSKEQAMQGYVDTLLKVFDNQVNYTFYII